jgi:hypothetical protein
MADEHFNAPPDRGCPVCLRQRSLVLSRDGSGLLDCGDATPLRSIRDLDGCGARFRQDGRTLHRVEPTEPVEYRPPLEHICGCGAKVIGSCTACSAQQQSDWRRA